MICDFPPTRRKRPALVTVLAIIWLLCPADSLFSAPRKRRPRYMRMEATAFSLDSKPTSAGTTPREGIVAADRSVLPLGSRIRVTDAGIYNGVYTVTDTGSKVNGRHIDFYMPSAAEAKKFGKRVVRVQVLETGSGKQDAREKEGVAAPAGKSQPED